MRCRRAFTPKTRRAATGENHRPYGGATCAACHLTASIDVVMEYNDHEACLSEVRRAVEGERSTLPRGANIGCSRACWASFRWQQATSRPYYDQTWAPTPPIAPARCHEACRSHGGDPRAPLQHFNRKTARKWPRTWHRPAHRPLDANQGWHMRWGRQQAADDARCAHEA